MKLKRIILIHTIAGIIAYVTILLIDYFNIT